MKVPSERTTLVPVPKDMWSPSGSSFFGSANVFPRSSER